MKDQKYRDTQRDICTRFLYKFFIWSFQQFRFLLHWTSIQLSSRAILDEWELVLNNFNLVFFEGEILWSPESVFLPPFHLFESFLSHFSHVLHLFFPQKQRSRELFPVFPFFIYRERGEFLDLKRCQYLTSEDFCSLTAQQIEAIIDTPIPETW